MHREESAQLATCCDCGTSVAVGPDRAYAFGAESVLCWDCALRRGGRWDDEEDRWSQPPRVDDLPVEESEPS